MSDQFPEQFVRWDTFSSALPPGRDALHSLRGEILPAAHRPDPACHARTMEPYQCAQSGVVVTVALDDVGFPALGYGDALPRVQAIIRLDDGIHLMVDIIQVEDPGEVQPGSRVKMILRKHKREDTGAWVYGFGFILDRS
jgi:uncharacterized OB-fold protein